MIDKLKVLLEITIVPILFMIGICFIVEILKRWPV